ncbi:MAG: hypothetical protein IKZ95_05340 [Lachnospiraceae bacterium]|nr:hypothetical protein [Lachnospiraceae bacterium]
MVGKMIKYDFMSFFRLIFPVQIIIIGLAGLNRIVQIFETQSSTYRTVFVSSIVLLSVACVVAAVMSYVVAIVRFYQGLYSSEGYLSHSLPLTAAQHITSKLIVSILFELGTALAIFIAVNIATLGDVGVELYKAGGYLLKQIYGEVHFNMVLYILEAIIFVIVALATGLLLMYFCISIGQLVNRKKILLAFGVLFGIYMLGQIIGTIGIIVGPILVQNEAFRAFLQNISDWFELHVTSGVHIIAWIMILLQAIFGFIYFLITERIMTKRLNLS